MGWGGRRGLNSSSPLAGSQPTSSQEISVCTINPPPRNWAMPRPLGAASSAHAQDDVAVFLEEVPISLLGDRHHLQVLGEKGAWQQLGNAPPPSTTTLGVRWGRELESGAQEA